MQGPAALFTFSTLKMGRIASFVFYIYLIGLDDLAACRKEICLCWWGAAASNILVMSRELKLITGSCDAASSCTLVSWESVFSSDSSGYICSAKLWMLKQGSVRNSLTLILPLCLHLMTMLILMSHFLDVVRVFLIRVRMRLYFLVALTDGFSM